MELVEFSTPILDATDVSENDTSDSEHILVKSSIPVQVAMYSLNISMIENGIEHKMVDTSVITSDKSFEFFRTDCCYVIGPNFSSSESVKFFTMIHQVTPNVSSYGKCLELFSDFGNIFVGPNDVIPLTASDVRPPRKHMYLFVLSLGVLPSEFVALHLPGIHDEICRRITFYNKDYKFVAYPHIILQKFAVKNVLMATIHSERFPLGTMSQLHARRTGSIRVLRRITFITNELDFP